MGSPGAMRRRRVESGKGCQDCEASTGIHGARGYLRLCHRCLQTYGKEAIHLLVKWEACGWRTWFVRDVDHQPIGRVRSYTTHLIPLRMVMQYAAHPLELERFRTALCRQASSTAMLVLTHEQVRKLE